MPKPDAPDHDRLAISRSRLEGLLRRTGLSGPELPTADGWQRFLDNTVALLADVEQDRYLLERSLDTSSGEMLELTESLRAAAEALQAEREELRATNALLTATLESTGDGILVVDEQGKIVSFNGRFVEMWQIPADALDARDDDRALGFVLEQLEHPSAFVAKIRELYTTPAASSQDVLEFKDGRVFERESRPQLIDGTVAGRVWSFRDVTDRRRLESDLAQLAFKDPLTGLANRAVFGEHIDQALRRQARLGGLVVVSIVDVDGFKHLNDSLGHEAGDLLLVSVARRLEAELPDADTIARLGGDEFAVIVTDVASPEDAGRVAQRTLDAFAAALPLADVEVTVTASVGLAVAPAAGSIGAGQLLGHADVAVARAKREGKNCYRLFEPWMQAAAVERVDLEQALRRASASGALRVSYQPIVLTASGEVSSVEALARWPDTRRGFIPPATFIPIAEDTGLILDIGRAVLLEACRQGSEWVGMCPDRAPGVSVNVSGRQLVHEGFVADVAEALSITGFDPSKLTLEITESVLSTESRVVLDSVAELRGMGIRIAIDDFGTGYSSLAMLSEVPVDTLKIDKRFIDNLDQDHRARGLLRAVLAVADTLGLDAVAEGVETERQHRVLSELGCRHSQGYLFAHPMSPEEAGTWLQAHVPGAAETSNATGALRGAA